MHARHRIDHLMYTGESEVDHRGFGDVDAGTAETGLRLGQREALDELVGDLVAHFIADDTGDRVAQQHRQTVGREHA